MVAQRKMIITESERNRIRSLYEPKKGKDFVFDFVLTENEKYLIIMDQVFVAGGNGNSIGSIWEHTYIFNEIINESISKMETLNEEIKTNINNIVETIEWKKELVLEWIKEKGVISEGETWDKFKSGVSNIASKVGNAAVETAKTIFNKGVLPALRWVRRGLYTGVGIVIDVVVSILAAKTNAIVWFVVVLLDIYEIATGDYDPKDPDRMQMPFFFLIADLIGCVFTGAAALGFKKVAPVVASQGLKKGAPAMVKMVEGLAQKIPSLKGQLKGVADTLSKKLGPSSTGVIGKILGFIDNILTKFSTFLQKLFSKEGIKATATGGAVLGVGKVAEKGLGKLDKGNKIGTAIAKFDQNLKNKTGLGTAKFASSEGDAILSMAGIQ
jgi:hypothetical protein